MDCVEALFDYCEMFGYIHEDFNRVMFKLYEAVLEVAHHNECYKQYWNKRIIRISEVANDFYALDCFRLYGFNG